MEKVKGWGFVNENLEILCIKTEGEEKKLALIPWRQANPNEVIILWDSTVSALKSILGTAPFMDIVDNGGVDLDSLEAMFIEKNDTTIWIG
jgi:hypothetical protein